MSARDWIDKDFYAELGVPSDAPAEDIKRSYRKLARELHPDANPDDKTAEQRFKAVSEAYGVLSDAEKRRQYDEARTLFGGGSFRPGGFGAGGAGAGGFDLGDLFTAGGGGARASAGGGGLGDLLGGLFSRRGAGPGAAAPGARAQRGADVNSEVRIDFEQAVRGTTVPLRVSSPSRCDRCAGTGSKPGSPPRICPTCAGVGLVSSSQGAFAFSEPCRDCRGTGRLIDDPCPDCGGSGVTTKSRTLTVRIPPGVKDGQRIRLAGQGEPGRNGAPAGDLFVKVHVTPHSIFGRSGNNLTLEVPVTFPELVLGTTLTVPTLDGKVSLKVPAGTTSGRTMRVRNKGVQKKDGVAGDLLVTVRVSIPPGVDGKAKEALEAYAQATADHDPRSELTALLATRE